MEERNENGELGQQPISVLFFSPCPYFRGFLVCSIVPSLAHNPVHDDNDGADSFRIY